MRRFLIAFFILLLPIPALALSGDWVRDDAVSVRLISGVDGVGDAATVPLGLDIELGNGWHTYWRSPGEAGLPPQLDWSRSETDMGNVQSATLQYPAPHRYSAYGLETVGYRDHVLFPIDVALRAKGQPLNADVGVDLLVCSSICLPKHFDLTLTVPAGEATAATESALLAHARDQLPTDPASAGLLLQSVKNNGDSLTFSITANQPLTQPDIFIEDDKNIGFGAPQVSLDAQGYGADLTVRPVDTLPAGFAFSGMPVTLTLADGDRATELKITLPPVTAAPAATANVSPLPLPVALLFALIGGFILNLMPCVLPVLSLKLLSVVSHGGGDKTHVRRSFLVTAAGILFSFFILACATVALRAFGVSLGWGVQFQQPAFLIFLIFILVFFAVNLWGLFDIPLPRFLADRMDAAYHPRLAGDFATGAFATLLATPCSAPFLGTAVGYALAAGAGDIFAIFMMLGLGFCLPYLAVALFPRVATILPKPGAWMVVLRRIMGAALAATAVWLIWVLAAQITARGAFIFALFMAAILILLLLKKQGVRRRLITVGIVEFCLAAILIALTGAMQSKPPPQAELHWLPFNQNALRADIAEGKTVFLDITADWCLTCKANMKFTLTRDAVAQRLFHDDIIAMQGDWTNPDPVITDLLHSCGRYGIPFNAVFGPGAPQGIVLPELLTQDMVLQAIDKAAGESGR